MKIFITGASGWIGRHLVPKLISRGHSVLALSRSPTSSTYLQSLGATPHQGSLTDLPSLQSGASSCDVIIHLAFIHDFLSPTHDLQSNLKVDSKAVFTMAEAVKNTNKVFINTAGTLGDNPGQTLTESFRSGTAGYRKDHIDLLTAEYGLNAFVVRLSPSVHGDGDQGFVPMYIDMAKKNGFAAYIDEGKTRWSGCHVEDAAEVYALIVDTAEKLRKGNKEGMYFHAVADEGVAIKKVAEAVGKGLGMPTKSVNQEEAGKCLGFMSRFASIDGPASSEITKKILGWEIKHKGLIEDLNTSKTYFA